MAPLLTWMRYLHRKAMFAREFALNMHARGQFNHEQAIHAMMKCISQEKLTFPHWFEGATSGSWGGTLLVRKIFEADSTKVSVGDFVLVKDPNPENPKNFLVRRLAAIEGDEMVSSEEKGEPFVLEENECWVLANDDKLNPKGARDSRSFGPVPVSSIIGRVIYCLRTASDHGPVQNSSSMEDDSVILEIELDVDELTKELKS